MFNIQLVAGNKIPNRAYLLNDLFVSQKKNPERMDQTSRLPPANLKWYRCVPIESEQIGLQYPVFRPEFDQFFEKKNTLSFPSRNTESSPNPRSELSPGQWTSQTKAKNPNVFFQDKNTTNKKINKTDHRI